MRCKCGSLRLPRPKKNEKDDNASIFKINPNEWILAGGDQGRGLGLVIFVVHEQFVYICKFKSKRMPFFGVIKGGIRVVADGDRFHAGVSIIKKSRLP